MEMLAFRFICLYPQDQIVDGCVLVEKIACGYRVLNPSSQSLSLNNNNDDNESGNLIHHCLHHHQSAKENATTDDNNSTSEKSVDYASSIRIRQVMIVHLSITCQVLYYLAIIRTPPLPPPLPL